LTCNIHYLKYISLGRRVKQFDFNRADVDRSCAHLAALDWFVLFADLGIDDCVEKFHIIICKCFNCFVSLYYSVDSENSRPG
jgi:hypothetical protein